MSLVKCVFDTSARSKPSKREHGRTRLDELSLYPLKTANGNFDHSKRRSRPHNNDPWMHDRSLCTLCAQDRKAFSRPCPFLSTVLPQVWKEYILRWKEYSPTQLAADFSTDGTRGVKWQSSYNENTYRNVRQCIRRVIRRKRRFCARSESHYTTDNVRKNRPSNTSTSKLLKSTLIGCSDNSISVWRLSKSCTFSLQNVFIWWLQTHRLPSSNF